MVLLEQRLSLPTGHTRKLGFTVFLHGAATCSAVTIANTLLSCLFPRFLLGFRIFFGSVVWFNFYFFTWFGAVSVSKEDTCMKTNTDPRYRRNLT